MSLRIAAIQHDIIWEDSAANFARLTPQIERAVSAGGRLVVLSEMFSMGFTMNSLNCAEPLEGPSFHFLSEAATNHQVGVVGSIPT